MERDTHGLEYAPWHKEVEYLWKQVFQLINPMAVAAQRAALEMIRELWSTYLTYYAAFSPP